MITSDKTEAERWYPDPPRGEYNLRVVVGCELERAAYIAGREDERAARFYGAADALADLRRQLDEARRAVPVSREWLAELRDNLSEEVFSDERAEIARLLAERP